MNSQPNCTPSPARHVSAPEKWALAAAKAIRILTIPPIMAALMPILLRAMRGYFPGAALWLTILFLSILPTLSYLVWAAISELRAQGRGMQRKLAVAFSVAGYVAGVVYCLAAGLGRVEQTIYLTYFFSGALIAILSACHLKSSGHACGMAGPILVLGLEASPWFFLGFGLLGIVFWSSLRLGRHTARELVLGAATPMVFIALLSMIL